MFKVLERHLLICCFPEHQWVPKEICSQGSDSIQIGGWMCFESVSKKKSSSFLLKSFIYTDLDVNLVHLLKPLALSCSDLTV